MYTDIMKQKFWIICGIIALLLIVSFFVTRQRFPTPEDAKIRDAVITLQRTACFGTCPIYKLTVYGTGEVQYEGEDYVKVKGKQSASISAEKVKELVNEFYKINYFSLKDKYEGNITDLPTTFTSITIDGKSKQVENYYGAPDSLNKLEDLIDEITNSAQWVK